jgi:PTS system mannose-specific IIB component
MSIVLTRIDNRLIHGQVLEAWVPFTRADCIVVANDQVAGMPMQCKIMQASVPKNIKVLIGSLAEVNQFLRSDEFAHLRVLLLFETSEDALQAHQQGIVFDTLNLGNMHAGEGKVRFSCTLALDPEDINNLVRLEESGVHIACQCIPADKERPWRKLIREDR